MLHRGLSYEPTKMMGMVVNGRFEPVVYAQEQSGLICLSCLM